MMEIALVLGLLLVAIVLFATEKLSVDLVTMMLLIILVASGILSPEQAFAGFSSDFVLILASIFVITAALQSSGILDVLVGRLVTLRTTSLNRLLLYIMLFTSVVGAFMNNTTITAMLVNPVVGLAKKANVSASKLLIPLAFSSIVGGNCTLIGTSTNVAVSGYMAKAGMEPLGMFEIFHLGSIITGMFMVYMMTVGKKMLPDTKTEALQERYGLRNYLSEIAVMPTSPLIGQRVFRSDLSRLNFRILALIRDSAQWVPSPETTIAAGDLLLVEGKIEELLRVKETSGIQIKADTLDFYAPKDDIRLGEALLPARSHLLGSSIKSSNFRQHYGVVVLAIHRAGQALVDKIGEVELAVGDVLLVQGVQERFSALKTIPDVIMLGEYQPQLHARRRGIYTFLFFSLAILVGTLGWLPLSVAFLAAAVLTVLFKGITLNQAYENIDWRLLVLIAGMSAFGTAMSKTGTDVFLADLIIRLFNPLGVTGILGGFILLTVLLTQPMSNAAAALVVLPIALQTAHNLQVNPRSFAIAVMMAASVSLITPFEPACILVYGPGKYRFRDFIKIGSGITLLVMLVILLLVPVFWPL